MALGLVVIVLTAACGGGTNHTAAAKSGLASVKVAAANPAAAEDAQTDAILDAMGLRHQLGARADAVYAALRSARRAAFAKVAAPTLSLPKQTSAQQDVPVPAQLTAESGALTFGLQFSSTYADWLDPATQASASGESGSQDFHVPPAPPASTDNGSQTVTTTTEMDFTPGVFGSVVTLRLTGTVKQTVTDDATHAVLAQLSDARSYTGKIDVCPGSGGEVPASLTVDIRITGATTTATDHGDGTLLGHVDDSAALTGVEDSFEHTTNWTSGQGKGSVDVKLSNESIPGDATNGINMTSVDISQVQGSVTLTGNATDADARRAAASESDNTLLMQPVIAAAQDLWRHGRCVVVAVPDYQAETPIRVVDQGSVQHTEDVDKSSETTFGVALKHRFGPPPTAPVDAALSGDKSIDPDQVPAAPASFKYTAGDQDDAKAQVTLVSTSRRGIGKLLLDFAVKPRKLALAMNGTISFGQGGVTLSGSVHGSTATFTAVGDGTYRASLPATASYSLTFPGENCSSANGNEGRGSLVFNATPAEGPDNKPVWHVTLDGTRSQVHTNETACGISFSDLPLSGAGAGLAGVVASAAGLMTFPADGGTIHVHKNFVDATFVATVPK